MNNFGRNIFFWVGVGLVLVVLLNLMQSGKMGAGLTPASDLAYSDFMGDAKNGRISDVVIKGQEITGHYTSNDEKFSVYRLA